jgi:hypothetical protein
MDNIPEWIQREVAASLQYSVQVNGIEGTEDIINQNLKHLPTMHSVFMQIYNLIYKGGKNESRRED